VALAVPPPGKDNVTPSVLAPAEKPSKLTMLGAVPLGTDHFVVHVLGALWPRLRAAQSRESSKLTLLFERLRLLVLIVDHSFVGDAVSPDAMHPELANFKATLIFTVRVVLVSPGLNLIVPVTVLHTIVPFAGAALAPAVVEVRTTLATITPPTIRVVPTRRGHRGARLDITSPSSGIRLPNRSLDLAQGARQ
jgi:hypothetical protein